MSKIKYRPCVGMMLFNKDNLIFTGQRIDSDTSAWQMPQGGIDENETPLQAVYRELKEEIGTDNVKVICQLEKWLSYDLPDELRKKLWKGKYRGQKQKWFALKYLGEDKDINISLENPEFKKWKWLNPIDLPNIAIGFKKEIYLKLLNELVPMAQKEL
ncbi:RNA pyrophosphohydrolase [Alphaproteobacteria bacterium]|nr:RNA pyrophosphohydrolase [Alphaproteobacteria bacterium]